MSSTGKVTVGLTSHHRPTLLMCTFTFTQGSEGTLSNAAILRPSIILATILARMSASMSVSVSASWNANLNVHGVRCVGRRRIHDAVDVHVGRRFRPVGLGGGEALFGRLSLLPSPVVRRHDDSYRRLERRRRRLLRRRRRPAARSLAHSRRRTLRRPAVLSRLLLFLRLLFAL